VSSLQQVTDPAAVRLLLQPRVRAVLGVFLHGEQTTSGAARELKTDLRQVHRDVRALASAGLLIETQMQARAGRAIRHYRASAPAYFVPRALTPDADFAERFERQFLPVDRLLMRAVGRAFEQAISEQGAERAWGLRVYWDGHEMQIDESYEDAELRGVLTGWQGPQLLGFTGLSAGRLTPEEALDVQLEFVQLVTRLKTLFEANSRAGRGQPFAVRTVLAPVTAQELDALRP
jgi:predicted transcriptional regulator